MPIEMDIPLANHTRRRQNRETFVRLFQGFVNEFGEVAGKKIVKHLVDLAGGYRILIPAAGPDPLFGCSSQFRRLWVSTCREFGSKSGHKIMSKIIAGLGGRRVWFPDYKDLFTWDRNKKILDLFDGTNCRELACRFKLSSISILRIIRSMKDTFPCRLTN